MKKEKGNYDYNSTFPTRIRDLMGENKTTQKELSLICGTQRQSVSHWLNGETRPDILSLVKIAEHFNVSTDYLLGLTDCMNREKNKYPAAEVERIKQLSNVIRILIIYQEARMLQKPSEDDLLYLAALKEAVHLMEERAG